MNETNEVREFLTSRRARLQPAQAGLPAFSSTRRVPGLRREEVALLSQMSVDYYTRLERGNLTGVSEAVLESPGVIHVTLPPFCRRPQILPVA